MIRHPYYTEPIRPALVQAALLAGLAILAPLSLLRVILLAAAVGALGWAFLQRQRSRQGVQLGDDGLSVQHGLRRTMTAIAYANVRGVAVSPRDGLIMAYQPPAPPAPLTTTPTVALMRPEPSRTRLLITPQLVNAPLALADVLARLPTEPTLPAETLLKLARGRRRRGWLLLLLAILGIPFYMYVIWRLVPLLR